MIVKCKVYGQYTKFKVIISHFKIVSILTRITRCCVFFVMIPSMNDVDNPIIEFDFFINKN